MPNDINVNMTPNPLDLQTLHCSQGDTGARKFKIKLHNNGEVIDTSNVKEQVEFPVYKGGTEELLPTNTSTPTTSPIDADIQYPQGLLTDQVFTYRESPTEEDGKAKIKTLRGNTLKWNQLVENGNFADTSVWTKGNCTFNVSNNVLTFRATAQYGNTYNTINNVANHVCLLLFEAKSYTNTGTVFFFRQHKTATSYTNVQQTLTNAWAKYNIRVKCDSDTIYMRPLLQDNNSSDWGDIQLKNVMVIDLTEMFGVGNEPTSVDEFTNLFPLPYYDYNIGTLLPFKGSGIKTTGKNRINIDDVQIGKAWNGASNTARAVVYAPCFPNTQYTLSFGTLNVDDILLIEKTTADATTTKRLASVKTLNPYTFTTDAESHVFGFQFNKANISASDLDGLNTQIEFGSSASSYEPYTSTTTDLPISTYFPTGMKRAGNVYDELTPSKAVKRLGMVDLGTLNWAHRSEVKTSLFSANAPEYKKELDVPSLCCQYGYVGTVYGISGSSGATGKLGNKQYALYYQEASDAKAIYLYDTSFTDATTLKQAMNGVYLVYELSEYEETPITTASLVTENGEIALKSEDDYLVGECNSDISENAGFIDAKVKLSDADGDIYSNKIQIHVERSPQ